MSQTRLRRVAVIVLDSAGVGELPDADRYGDAGSSTLPHVAAAVGGLSLPNLQSLGLGNTAAIAGVPPSASPAGAFGKMAEAGAGKSTTTGHWEIAGIVTSQPFPVYPHGFPPDVIEPFRQATGRGVLGNRPASGTQIIAELGAEHLRTGDLIVYTSADSVFQVAAHEDVVPVDALYRICQTARDLLDGPHGVERVIARPFVGKPGAFQRTNRRRDFSLPPPGPTLLDLARESGLDVIAVGKVDDIFAQRGITESHHCVTNLEAVAQTIDCLRRDFRGLLLANLVEFDTVYGHRNDAVGYARALEAFDARLPGLLALLGGHDALFITADHGCDPATPGTDHTREYVPLLAVGPPIRAGVDLGVRETFADLGATAAKALGLDWGERPGGSVLRALRNRGSDAGSGSAANLR